MSELRWRRFSVLLVITPNTICSPRESSLCCQDQLLRRDTKLLGQDRPSRSSDVKPGPCYAKQECWGLDGNVAGFVA